jgi:uncharacterized protein YbjQ (UPF0145 family)
MITSTTNTIEGRRSRYKGAPARPSSGTNIFRDFFAGIRDIVGGRSGAYEKRCAKHGKSRMREWRRTHGRQRRDRRRPRLRFRGSGSMLMVSASGTAVVIQ